MDELLNVAAPGIVQHLRDARNVPAVLKTKLASIRAHSKDVLIFACEGVDDRAIYFHWIKQVAPFLVYEFLVCNGKARVLEFRQLLMRDLSGLKDRVYFLVDRDFDELRGQDPGPDIFMTDAYSVENYLVTRDVLDQTLRMEIQCHSEPACRQKILGHFDKIYAEFLELTRPHNHRIFLSRRYKISGTRSFPERINLIAKVELDKVGDGDFSANEAISLAREPSASEVAESLDEFMKMDRYLRFRGKFAILFFSRWLQLVGEDRNAGAPKLFDQVEKPASAANGRVSLDALASKSSAPDGLRSFVKAIVASLPSPPLAA